MYSWSELLKEALIHSAKDPNEGVQFLEEKRKELLQKLSRKTQRNTILYFSAFLHKQTSEASINDTDMNAFMECVHGLDQKKGLDLILHTPGGDLAATEQIIYYLRSIFHGDVRAIIPQMAMSAGSMIAVSCREIIMGKQSCLGPFDPQLNGVPCQSAIKEFYQAAKDVAENPASLGLWQAIISKLNPTFLTLCQQADELGEELTKSILQHSKYDDIVKGNIKNMFSNSAVSKTHGRHINKEKCKAAGLNITDLEADQEIQDLVLGIHHCCMILGEQSAVVKIVENNIGGCYLCQQNQQRHQ